jgi:ketosteroid isomerase-like protein
MCRASCPAAKIIKPNHMKLIAPLIGICALSFATLALSQETQTTSPAPSTTEATSTAAPETTSVTTGSPQPAAQRKEKPETTPAPTQKRAAPPKVASPGSTASKKMSAEEVVKANENRWEASYAAHDISVPQALLANDFAGVYWDGRVMSKSGVISETKKDRDTYKSAVNEKLSVHSYGPNLAVVIGTAHEQGTGKDGKPFDRAFRFTDTWLQRGGQWQCVASHVMKVKG